MVVNEGCQFRRGAACAHRIGRAAWLAVVLVTACVESPPRIMDPVAMEQRAQDAIREGRPSEAADMYMSLASASSGPRRSAYLIQSASLLASERNYAQARFALNQAQASATPEQQQHINVLLAEIELGQGNAAIALDMLDTLGTPNEPGLQREASLARARALFALERFEAAVRQLIERELWLESAADILDNQRALWSGLSLYRDQALPLTGDSIVDGWLALAPIAATENSRDDQSFKQALLSWRANYPTHPAASSLLPSLRSESFATAGFPTQIALLLPLSSVQRAAAIALQDGFMAAYLEDNRPGARLRVYDTTALGAATAYLNAQLDGADFIVGPLLRPEVEAVAAQGGFVPTLALNFLPPSATASGAFFQFALAPEDEAQQIARRAASEGATTALALIPENDWGIRLLRSFEAEFAASGGRVLRTVSYDPAARDFSGPITALLNLSDSTQRYRRLAANLGVALQFEPRRRSDVDMLFIAANSAVAHLIGPQLRFHYAGDIPTYATSEIYEPGRESNNADLNGIYFTDMPWVLGPDPATATLQSTLRTYWPQRFSGQGMRFYAMGFDAYRLIAHLYGPAPLNSMFAGASGELLVDPGGQIHRRLPLAQFRNGRPVVVSPTASKESELAQLAQ
jgi:outer membrane PBP1 activator LpoA protein